MVADLDVFFIKAMIGPRGANSNHGGVQERNVYSTGKTVTSEQLSACHIILPKCERRIEGKVEK